MNEEVFSCNGSENNVNLRTAVRGTKGLENDASHTECIINRSDVFPIGVIT